MPPRSCAWLQRSSTASCNGTDAKRPTPLKEALAKQYPGDQAVGFEVGDFRGFFWAEVPKGGK